MRKSYLLKLTTIILAILLMIPLFTFLASAEEIPVSESVQQISNPNYKKWDNIPLLVLLVSYDANGNGADDYSSSDYDRLFRDPKLEYYGEQWITSRDDTWANRIFNASNSLMAFYKEMTQNRFWFTPANETYENASKGGKVNDGIVQVVVHDKHPFAATGNESTESHTSRLEALRQASKYVDFKSFDKDKNGKITDDELSILYIAAGTEYSSSSSPLGLSSRLHFSVHAHYTSGTGINIGGVTVGAGGFTRIGEYVTTSEIATVGVIAHELGHFLGAPDLYDTVGSWNYAGNMSLMASGSWLRYNNVKGMGAAYLDAPLMVYLGFADYTEIKTDGTYTLSSRESKNPYNIIKISTPNPNEYYLIENRYSSEDAIFDQISDKNKAIIIWHVDETLLKAGYAVNSSSSTGVITKDPAVVVMSDSGLSASSCGYTSEKGNFGNIFTPKNPKYKFPYSGRNFTRLSEKDAEKFNFTVTVESSAGKDMKIKVNFYDTMPVYISGSATDITLTEATLNGFISTYNGKNVDTVSFIVSKNSNPDETNGTKYPCQIEKDGSFTAKLENLESNTKYFYKIVVESKGEKSERTNFFYTDIVHKERTEYYIVYMYKALTDVERSFEVKVKPGNTLKYNFPMNKLGYVFCGWYTDPDFKTKYDMSFTQDTCTDFSLYAKWAKPENTASLKLIGANSVYPLFAIELGDTFPYVEPDANGDKTFDGWYSDPDFSIPFDFEEKVYTSGVTEIYAKWISNEESVLNPETETTTLPETTETTSTVNETETQVDTTTTPNEEPRKTSVLTNILLIGIIALFVTVILIFFGRRKQNSPQPDNTTPEEETTDTDNNEEIKKEEPEIDNAQDTSNKEIEESTENSDEEDIKSDSE